MSVVPFIKGKRVLEIGHGPGHLQKILLSRNLIAVGIDESGQMGRLAKRNLTRLSQSTSTAYSLTTAQYFDYTQINLARGVAQRLPFPNEIFDTIVATFPTEYITDPNTLSEVKRCLSNDGRLVVLPAALPKNPFLDWLFRVTHQSPIEAVDVVRTKFKEPFLSAGFKTEIETLDLKSGILFVIVARKEFSTG